MSGTTIKKAGTILEGVKITGTLHIQADDVVVRNFVLESSGHYGIRVRGARNVLIEDGDISGMKSAGIYGGNFTARRLRIHNSGNDAIKANSNVVVEGCWFYNLGYIDDAHADGIQMRSGKNVVIRGNYFDMGPTAGYRNSICMIIQTGAGPIDGVVIEDNWINGGGYSIQIRDKGRGHGPPTNVRIVNNRFGRDFKFKPWRVDGDALRAGNVWDDSGRPLRGQSRQRTSE